MMRIHPECERSCTHHLVPELGGRIVQRHVDKGTREESEATLRRKYPDLRLDYLGISAEHSMHTWRLGGRPWKPMPATSRTEGKQAVREVKAEYRPAVWEGTGSVGPIDFSRAPQEAEQLFPAPSLTSGMPCPRPASAPVAGLLAHAERNGWQGVITMADGHVPHATHGRPSAQAKFSEALRLQRGRERAVAVRLGGSWTSLWTWSDQVFFTRHATLEAFRQAIAQPVDNPVDNPGAFS